MGAGILVTRHASPEAQRLTGQDTERALVILGSGLNAAAVLDEHLTPGWQECEHPFSAFGIIAPAKGGHPGTFVLSEWDGVPIVVSRGRVHLFQVWQNPRVLRAWIANALALMGKGRRVIVTNAVSGLKPFLGVGSIVIPSNFVAAHFPPAGYLDGWSDGHPAPEVLLPTSDSPFVTVVMRHARAVELAVHADCRYIPVVGPRFGGRGERELFGEMWMCDTIGMSLLPEIDLIAVENMSFAGEEDATPYRVGPLQIVSDNQDVPSDTAVLAAVADVAPKVGDLTERLLQDESW